MKTGCLVLVLLFSFGISIFSCDSDSLSKQEKKKMMKEVEAKLEVLLDEEVTVTGFRRGGLYSDPYNFEMKLERIEFRSEVGTNEALEIHDIESLRTQIFSTSAELEFRKIAENILVENFNIHPIVFVQNDYLIGKNYQTLREKHFSQLDFYLGIQRNIDLSKEISDREINLIHQLYVELRKRSYSISTIAVDYNNKSIRISTMSNNLEIHDIKDKYEISLKDLR